MRRIRVSKNKWTTVDDWMYDDLLARGPWNIATKGYVKHSNRPKSGGKTNVMMHHVVLQLAGIKIPPGMQVDHRNGRKRDNRLSNLRLATPSQQGANRERPRNNTSGHTGVSWHKHDRNWQAYIYVNYRQIHLGRFTSKLQAARAYRAAADKYFGEFARHNSRQSKPAA